MRSLGRFSEARLGAPSPVIKLGLLLPRWGVAGALEFLVDTGSARTVLHPIQAQDLDVPLDDLIPSSHARSWGVGGIGAYAEEPASLVVTTDDGRTFELDTNIWIALPDPYNIRLPSLLGRDVLQYFRLTVDLRDALVALDVADELFGIAP